MSSSSLEIVSEFTKVLDGDKNYTGAAALLHDESFKFTSPKANFGSKEDWLDGFPELHKDPPTFEEPRAVEDDDFKVTRKGFIKLGFMKINIMETYTVDEASGTILQISAAMKMF